MVLSAEEEQPEQKREQPRQTGVNQDRPNDHNLLPQQQPSADSREENADGQAHEPGWKKRAHDVKRRGAATA
jgi:hypothetical protein